MKISLPSCIIRETIKFYLSDTSPNFDSSICFNGVDKMVSYSPLVGFKVIHPKGQSWAASHKDKPSFISLSSNHTP